jgi:alanyl-tRNA synthetase
MGSEALRKIFLEFFQKRGHTVVPSSSLLPDDPSVLLTTAGMQQFKPYFIGKADPIKDFGSLNTASIQKSFRTSDIDEVGDERHLTFFEMMGNFSFGGYFKEEAIKYAYDFFKEIGLPIQYVTVFAGDPSTSSGQGVPKDEESKKIWEKLGIGDIREEGRQDNFWGPTGNEGPCGPTTEIYIKGTEIWNIVFNEYYQHPDKTLEKLKTPGVDTGMGLERLCMVSQGKENIFETDLFTPFMEMLPEFLSDSTKRIIVDHARAIVFLIGDGVLPSNKDAGYILRRLIRRFIVRVRGYSNEYFTLLGNIADHYKDVYFELNREKIFPVFRDELSKFEKTLVAGELELGKLSTIDAVSAFKLYESYGLPYEVIKDLGKEKTKNLTREDFDKEFAKHQEISRAGQERKFGGHGLLLDTGELKAANEEELKTVTRLHTATHLLQAALKKVLGETVHQAGSDITVERTRFDFTFDRKLTPEELKNTEQLVNTAIEKDLSMEYKEMPFEEAIATGALYSPREKYPAQVKVYSAWNPQTHEVFSKELCGGPHVSHTGEVGHFKIVKEEAVSSGVRRLRAVVGKRKS